MYSVSAEVKVSLFKQQHWKWLSNTREMVMKKSFSTLTRNREVITPIVLGLWVRLKSKRWWFPKMFVYKGKYSKLQQRSHINFRLFFTDDICSNRHLWYLQALIQLIRVVILVFASAKKRSQLLQIVCSGSSEFCVIFYSSSSMHRTGLRLRSYVLQCVDLSCPQVAPVWAWGSD